MGENGMTVADYYMLPVGLVCLYPGSILQRVSGLHRHKYNKGYIDYARPWEPMNLDADDVVGALQERLICIGVWRDDWIVADPFHETRLVANTYESGTVDACVKDVYSTRWAL